MLMNEFMRVRENSNKNRAVSGASAKPKHHPAKAITDQSICDMKDEIENEEEGVVSDGRMKVRLQKA